MNNLTTFYKKILTSLDCVVEDDGLVLMQASKNSTFEPINIRFEGKNLKMYVPYKSVLRAGEWDKVICFHPGCETAFSGQSEIINTLQNLVSLKIFRAVNVAVVTMLNLAIDKSLHQNLRLDQKQLVSDIGECSSTCFKYIDGIFKEVTGIAGDKALLTLKLKRGDTIDGTKYERTCRLFTPMLDQPDPIFGIKASGVTQHAVRNAFTLAFPKVRAIGTNTKDAAYFQALMMMYYEMGTHLNKLRQIMGKYCGDMHLFDLGWFEQVKDIQKLTSEFMPQVLPGNTGRPTSKQSNVVEPVQPVAHMPKPVTIVPNVAQTNAPTITTPNPITPSPIQPQAHQPQVSPFANVPPVTALTPEQMIVQRMNSFANPALMAPSIGHVNMGGLYQRAVNPGMQMQPQYANQQQFYNPVQPVMPINTGYGYSPQPMLQPIIPSNGMLNR